uniref:Uncharacterized protein n=1 Tax=Oncorhynchus kisutch TaxID=8019 RepID=A0A8C7FWU4_ONCKI
MSAPVEMGLLHFLVVSKAHYPEFIAISGHSTAWQRCIQLWEKYQSVCSQHIQTEDFEKELNSQLMGLPCRRTLKGDAAPSIFSFTSKRKASDQPTSEQQKRSQAETNPADDDLNTSFSSTAPVDPLDESFQPGISLISTSSDLETSQDSQSACLLNSTTRG